MYMCKYEKESPKKYTKLKTVISGMGNSRERRLSISEPFNNFTIYFVCKKKILETLELDKSKFMILGKLPYDYMILGKLPSSLRFLIY